MMDEPTASQMILYKFRAFNEYGLKLLINREIYCAAPASLNDPLDCQYPLHEFLDQAIEESEGDIKEILLHIKEHENISSLSGLPILLNRMIQDKIESVGIFSASRCAQDALMWAHYGASHTGFCVGFKKIYFDKLKSNHRKNDILGASCVKYYDKPPLSDVFKIEAGKLLDILGKNNIDNSKELDAHQNAYIEELVTGCLTMKSSDWRYEKEFRLVKRTPGTFKFFPDDISEIIIGQNASNENIETIKNLLSSLDWKDVKLRRAKFAPRSFSMVIEDLE
jgi:hypothetical protein